MAVLIREYWPKKVYLKPLQVSGQSTPTGMQISLCSDHLINYKGKSDVPKPSHTLGSCWIQYLCLCTTSLTGISTDLLYAQTVVAISVMFCEVSRDSVREKRTFLVLKVPMQPHEPDSFRTQKANLKN